MVEYQGKILLVKQSYGRGLWTIPGGGIRRGETPEEATKREVREEVGIQLEDVKHIGKFISTSEYKRDNVDIFNAASNGENFKIDNLEIIEAKWFPPNNLPEISEYAQKVLDLWRKK